MKTKGAGNMYLNYIYVQWKQTRK